MDQSGRRRGRAPRSLYGTSRREFLKICGAAAAAVGIPGSLLPRVVEAASSPARRPSVVWLHFQECTGCTETLLRTSHPAVAQLILEMISLDYHETLFAAAGNQAEAALKATLEREKGKFICVVEGAIPTAEGGRYCRIGGRTALQMLQEVAEHAAAIVAVGSCASFGGLPAAEPNPTGAKGAPQVLPGKTVVTLPGCPAHPDNLLGVVLQYATFGTLPALDALGRPEFAYARTIHEDCPRRPHFDAGRFAKTFGDEGHRHGHCLYALGCKGPQTHARCSVHHFNEVVGAWPVGIGHPCVGCTEQKLAFRVPLHQTVDILRPTPPAAAPPVGRKQAGIDPTATGLAGVLAGAAVGAGVMVSRRLDKRDRGDEPKTREE